VRAGQALGSHSTKWNERTACKPPCAIAHTAPDVKACSSTAAAAAATGTDPEQLVDQLTRTLTARRRSSSPSCSRARRWRRRTCWRCWRRPGPGWRAGARPAWGLLVAGLSQLMKAADSVCICRGGDGLAACRGCPQVLCWRRSHVALCCCSRLGAAGGAAGGAGGPAGAGQRLEALTSEGCQRLARAWRLMRGFSRYGRCYMRAMTLRWLRAIALDSLITLVQG
jgi:hypothetical protein